MLRARTERWLRSLVDGDRTVEASEDSPLHIIVHHRDLDGELLDRDVAAVEIANLLRPIVAVGRYITFTALALHEHLSLRQTFEESDPDAFKRFAQEVRRFYPFFPFIGGWVREP